MNSKHFLFQVSRQYTSQFFISSPPSRVQVRFKTWILKLLSFTKLLRPYSKSKLELRSNLAKFCQLIASLHGYTPA